MHFGETSFATMKRLQEIYHKGYRPTANQLCLDAYVQSPEYVQDAQTAKIYYYSDELNREEAGRIATNREPVNIAMVRFYDQDALQKQFGYRTGLYSDPTSKTRDGQPFAARPNTVAIYGETRLWSRPGDATTAKRIACLSLPAPALDTRSQPHFSYYVSEGQLESDKYLKEMKRLAQVVVQAAIEHKDSARGGEGLARLVIPLYGQGNFLNALEEGDKNIARAHFFTSLREALSSHAKELQGIKIAISTFNNSCNVGGKGDEVDQLVVAIKNQGLQAARIVGDILQTAEEGDLIVNAWDPHSAPGNGNDGDSSFDGSMGKGSAIGAVQWPLINSYLNDPNRYVSLALSDDIVR